MKKNYHVTKTEKGWQGKLEKGERASVVGTTKKEVIQRTIEIAKRQANSSVKIHIKWMVNFKRKGLIHENQIHFLLKDKILIKQE